METQPVTATIFKRRLVGLAALIMPAERYWQILSVCDTSKDGFSQKLFTLSDGSRIGCIQQVVCGSKRGASRVWCLTIDIHNGASVAVVFSSQQQTKEFLSGISSGTLSRGDITTEVMRTDREFPKVREGVMGEDVRSFKSADSEQE